MNYTSTLFTEKTVLPLRIGRKSDRDFFRLIIEKVSGIGPRIALCILSKMSMEILQNAIFNQDTTLLSQCPGIGKKTVERLVIELKIKSDEQSVWNSETS